MFTSFSASPGIATAGVILRLRHLHNTLGEEWTERIAATGCDSDDDNRMNTASSVGTDHIHSVVKIAARAIFISWFVGGGSGWDLRV